MIATEQTYPVRPVWLLKPSFHAISVLMIFAVVVLHDHSNFKVHLIASLMLFVIVLFGLAVNVVIGLMRKATFHFSIGEKFLTVRQGIVRKQEKHVPYGLIQQIVIKQDLIDRLFGLKSFYLENASRGRDSVGDATKIFGIKVNSRGQGRRGVERIGFFGNRLSIPGLGAKDALRLRAVILKKMEENPVEDNQSGI